MNEQPKFCRTDGRPLSEAHHLSLNPRGKFVFRATIDQGAKFSGKRISVPLRTNDPALAARLRDVAAETLARAGLLTRDIVLSDEPDILEM
jgi:hypothetical protein